MKKEIWREVIGYEGMYEISNLARVRRGKVRSNIKKSGEIIAQRIDRHGYYIVEFWKSCRCKRLRVHVILMRAFIGERTAPDTRHLDGNKLNNDLSNLKYGTRSQNLLDDYKHNPSRKQKGVKRGSDHYLSRLTVEKVKEIRSIGKFRGYLKILSERFNVSIAIIFNIVNFKSHK